MNQDQLFEASYHVSAENYLSFNKLFFNKQIKHQTKISYIRSSIMIILSIIFAINIFSSGRQGEYLLDFLIAIIFLMGCYSILFYRLILPKNLEKNSNEAYKKTRFSKGEIKLKIFNDHIIESSIDGEKTINKQSISKIEEDDQIIVLITQPNYNIIINKNLVSPEISEFIINNFKGAEIDKNTP